MIVKRIDLFMPLRSQYGVLHHFTNKLYEALMRAGVNCRILVSEKTNPRPFLVDIFSDPPDCTLSFNGLLPDEHNRFLCDMLKIPHICCLVDPAPEFIPLIKSSYNIICCVDNSACDFFRKLNHENTIFLPHAVEKNLTYLETTKRPIEVLSLGSCIDYRTIADNWTKNCPKPLAQALFEAAELTLADQQLSFMQALITSIETMIKKHPEIDINNYNLINLFDQLQTYVKGFDRVRLIKSIKDARIDIYGTSKSAWESYLGKQSNCVFHEAVSFEDAFELMKKAKILLNSCITIKAGGHERIFSGMALGAVVAASENNFMRETFKDEENILFYRTKELDSLNDKINALLEDESKRVEIAKKGHDTVMKHHTWDNRCAILLKALPPILSI